jgi:hypothetical protein
MHRISFSWENVIALWTAQAINSKSNTTTNTRIARGIGNIGKALLGVPAVMNRESHISSLNVMVRLHRTQTRKIPWLAPAEKQTGPGRSARVTSRFPRRCPTSARPEPPD